MKSYLATKGKFIGPAGVTLAVLLLIVVVTLWQAGGDPLVFATLGSRYAQGVEMGSDGYDGQFVYYIAREWFPEKLVGYLDIPAYRYQRILYPLLGRIFAFGRTEWLGWVLIGLGVVAQVAGTICVAIILRYYEVSEWYALGYGLFPGLMLAVRLDLPEPLAYGLIAAGFLAVQREKHGGAWMLLSLAIFAKEVVLPFVVALGLAYLLERRWSRALGLVAVAGVPFLAFQGWLWGTFGTMGLGSGGAMATGFELVPFWGLLRIGDSSRIYLAAMLLVFGPTVVLPAVWGMIAAGVKLWKNEIDVVALALFLNALVIPFIPFSTYRETGGLLRFVCGLALALLLFAARYKVWRALNYSLFWLGLNAFLLKPDGL